ncbi:MAG TPA: MBL fold metallo-hydrolase [Patescibacteria group bacterium]|nr:MBL fold metallo-hydrolase [Patescibacteria group bacterium]
MAEITILVEGYVKEGGQSVQGTVTLVQDSGHNILVDPGMTYGPHTITDALQAHGLQPDDIDTIFITHHHPDHTRYMGLFLDARVYDYSSIYDGDQWLDGGDDYAITPNVKIMVAPGHTKEDAALVVTNVTNIPENNPCTVAICHLWWFEGKDDDPTAENMKQLRESRDKVLALTDFIVPGHGKMFQKYSL